MKYIIARSRYECVKEVLIPIEEIATIELRTNDNVVVYLKHKSECYFIDKETYYDLKSADN